ncbi:hypothetical protein ACLK2C_04975 [Escherichia coli]
MLPGWKEYPNQLGIALTDCITTDAFLCDFGVEFASRYQGLRHDSGDPVEWVKKPLHIMKKLGIDRQSKTLVPWTIWIYAKRLSYTATSLPARNLSFVLGLA